ncbi:major capsid protein [Sporosarcina phage Lietuvens]|nr:major capsid protein [Sporosarcina phage Lietuvens]
MTILQNQIVGKKEDVTDELLLLNPHQTPMLALVGYGTPVTQVAHAWFEDEMYADETTATAQALAAATTLSVADGSIFEKGHIIKAGEEFLLVEAVSTNDLTVKRGYADTVAADIESGDKVEFQFVEGVEGSDARKARLKARKRVSNVTQIFDETISISGTAAATSQYSIDNLYEYEKQKKQLELALQLEKAVINGIKYEASNGLTRQMGGLRNFVKTNVTDGAKAALTEDQLTDMFQTVFEKGGFATGGNYKIIVGAKQKRAISALGNSKIVLERQDNGRGQVVDHYLSDFGSAEIILNNNVGADEIFLVDANRVEIKPLQTRQFSHQFLGAKGDYVEGQIVGEYTLELHQEKAHARIKNLR